MALLQNKKINMTKKPKPKKKKTKNLKDNAWKWFSIFIRLKFSDKDGYVICYTCGRRMFWTKEGAQAGHFNTGRTNAILLNEEEIRVQCYQCNVCKYGEQFIFGEKLRAEVGEKAFKKIQRTKHTTKKITDKEWAELGKHYKQEAEKIAVEKCLSI